MFIFLLSQLLGLSVAFADTETYPDPSTRFRVGAAGTGSDQWVQVDVRTNFGKWIGYTNPECLAERKREQAQYNQIHAGEGAERSIRSEISQKEASADEITEAMLDPDLSESEETQLRNRRDHLRAVIAAKKEQLAELKKQKENGVRPLDGVHSVGDFFDVYEKNHPGQRPYGTDARCVSDHDKIFSDSVWLPFEMVFRIPLSDAAKSNDFMPLLRLWFVRYIASSGWGANFVGVTRKAYEKEFGNVELIDFMQVDYNRVVSLRDDRGITLTLKGFVGLHYLYSESLNTGALNNSPLSKLEKKIEGRNGVVLDTGFSVRMKFSSGFMAEFQNSLDWVHTATSTISGPNSLDFKASGDVLALTSILKAGFQSESEKWGVFVYVKRDEAYHREILSNTHGQEEIAMIESTVLNHIGGLEFEWHW